MSKKLIVLFSLLLLNAALWAQAAVDIPITVTDSAGGSIILNFGLAPTAADGIDNALGETVLPPLPPAGGFDVRFLIPNSTDASLKDYRDGTASNYTGTKVYQMQFQVGTGTKITLSWNLPSGVTGVLQDVVTGTLINVPMASGAGSYVVTNPGVFNKLYLTITYNLGSVVTIIPAVPTLLYPEKSATGVPTSTNLAWSKSAGAAKYTVQLSMNNGFTSFVINDSTLTDTVKAISGLINSSVYYWRVSARDITGSSLFADYHSFTTASAGLYAYNIPITVTDSAGGSKILNFGLAPTATDGIDTALGETPLPPLPPTGAFDVRFLLPGTTADASLKDYRQGTESYAGTKVYQMQYQVGTGTKITLSWNLPSGVTGVLQDVVTGTLINVAMASGAGSYVVTNPGVFNKLNLTITYKQGTSESINDNLKRADKFELAQNYPNPFNPSTMIRFGLPENARVCLTIFNQIGEQVAELVNGQMEAGYHQVTWNAANMSSGVYFYEIKTEKYRSIKKLVLLK